VSIVSESALPSAAVPPLFRFEEFPSSMRLRAINFSTFRRRTNALGHRVVMVALLLCGAATAQEDFTTAPSEEISRSDIDETDSQPSTTDETMLPKILASWA